MEYYPSIIFATLSAAVSSANRWATVKEKLLCRVTNTFCQKSWSFGMAKTYTCFTMKQNFCREKVFIWCSICRLIVLEQVRSYSLMIMRSESAIWSSYLGYHLSILLNIVSRQDSFAASSIESRVLESVALYIKACNRSIHVLFPIGVIAKKLSSLYNKKQRASAWGPS